MAIPTDPISLLGEWFRLQYERARRYASTFQGWDGIAWAKGLAHRTTPDAILLLWLVVGVAGAITLPLVAFTGARAANEADFDYDQWVARQQANQQAYNQNNDGKDWYNWKSNNGKYDDFDSYNEYNSYGYNQQQQQQYNYNNGGGYDYGNNIVQQNQYILDQEALDEKKKEECGIFYLICDLGPSVPVWFSAISEQASSADSDEPTKMLLFIYFWTIGFLLYMIVVVRQISVSGASVSESCVPFLMLTAYSFAGMLFLGGLTGAIRDEGALVAEHGWYGQTGVLLYMTYLCSFVLGLVFFFFSKHLAGEEGNQHLTEDDHERRHQKIQERVKSDGLVV